MRCALPPPLEFSLVLPFSPTTLRMFIETRAVVSIGRVRRDEHLHSGSCGTHRGARIEGWLLLPCQALRYAENSVSGGLPALENYEADHTGAGSA